MSKIQLQVRFILLKCEIAFTFNCFLFNVCKVIFRRSILHFFIKGTVDVIYRIDILSRMDRGGLSSKDDK